jgi:F-type H+-transporting ATPase subunit a
VAKKKGCLGCSLPVAIIILILVAGVVLIGLLAGPIGQKSLGIHGLPSWLSQAAPKPELKAPVVFHFFSLGVTNTILATWITMAVLIILFALAFGKSKLIPGRLQSALESILEWIYNVCTGTAGEKDGRHFFPLVATIFLFVGFNAWLALIPGYGSLTLASGEGRIELIRGANTDLNTTLALALITFFVVEIVGLSRLRFSYLKKFIVLGGIVSGIKKIFKGKIGQGLMEMFSGAMSAFAGLLELLSEFIRIISLTFRLFGNMTAGEILLISIAYLVPFLIPIIFYGLEILVGFIQALVFSGLTIVYISLAVTPHTEEHEHV